jgi:hypothetical protein
VANPQNGDRILRINFTFKQILPNFTFLAKYLSDQKSIFRPLELYESTYKNGFG